MLGYLRNDGRKGIRNVIVVAYLVECAHHVAREIVYPYRHQGVHLIGFSGCFPNSYAHRVMNNLCTHPNTGGVLLMSLGCEGFNRHGVAKEITKSGRPVESLVIQEVGGTIKTIAAGQEIVEKMLEALKQVPRVEMGVEELVVGTNCGGSDATSGLTANPAIGRAFDLLVARGAAAMFHETGELIGCEQWLAGRAVTPQLGQELSNAVIKAARYHQTLGHASFSPGNADGGLTTMEEKSAGAYCKSGTAPISGLLKPGDAPPTGGLYLLDIYSDGEVRFGFPGLSDVSGIIEMIASGCHLNLFSTGRGSVVGAAIGPVIKVCANPDTYRKMEENMDIDSGRILEGAATLDEVGREIYDCVLATAAGEPTCSEKLGHHECVLMYKSFEPAGPACLPTVQLTHGS